jgi:hypothetical protein
MKCFVSSNTKYEGSQSVTVAAYKSLWNLVWWKAVKKLLYEVN